jgi:hypothetical protein
MTRPVDVLFPQADRLASIAAGNCVKPPFGCDQPVREFTDDLSRREYAISGLCQSCQDTVFGGEE